MGDFQELRARIRVNIYTQTPILQAQKGKAIHPQLCRAGAEVKIQEYLPSNPHFHPKVPHAPPPPPSTRVPALPLPGFQQLKKQGPLPVGRAEAAPITAPPWENRDQGQGPGAASEKSPLTHPHHQYHLGNAGCSPGSQHFLSHSFLRPCYLITSPPSCVDKERGPRDRLNSSPRITQQ